MIWQVIKFSNPDKKILFHNVNLQYPRDFHHASGKAKWHHQKLPKYPVAFMDGHAEFFNFSWRLQSGYYPRARLTRAVRRQIARAGMTRDQYRIQWSIEELGYY